MTKKLKNKKPNNEAALPLNSTIFEELDMLRNKSATHDVDGGKIFFDETMEEDEDKARSERALVVKR